MESSSSGGASNIHNSFPPLHFPASSRSRTSFSFPTPSVYSLFYSFSFPGARVAGSSNRSRGLFLIFLPLQKCETAAVGEDRPAEGLSDKKKTENWIVFLFEKPKPRS